MGKQLLHIVAYSAYGIQIVEPDHVRTPLPSFHMSEKRSVCSHMDNIGITFQTGHKGSLEQGCVEMIPFLTFTVTSIFTGKNFRTFAVVIIITRTLSQEPTFRAIEMLVYQISFQAFHFRPQIIKFFSFGIRAGTTYNLHIRISLTNSLYERFKTFRIFFSPLLVTDTDKFQVERSRMSHIGAHLSPCRVHITIGELNQIECILNITVQIANGNVRFRIVILVLAGKTAIQNRKRFGTHFFR